MVELIDDDHVEVLRRELLHAVRREALHAREDVAPPLRSLTADVQLAEGAVGQHLPVGPQRLLQDLLSVGDEQQRRAMRQTRVVERRDDGLAGAGCGDDQVAVPVVQLALELEPVQDHLLMRVGTDLQAAHGKGDRAPVLRARRDRERLVEPLGVGLRVVVDEGAVGPVRVEGGLELGEQLGSVRAREFHVPLQAVQQSGPAQVRRADVGRAVARGAPEQPGLGVQPGRPRLVVDLDLRPEVAHQPVQRGVVRRTHVRRGDDPQRHSSSPQVQQLGLEHPEPVPLHEGAQQVHAVRGRQFRPQLGAQLGIRPRVGQERRTRQR